MIYKQNKYIFITTVLFFILAFYLLGCQSETMPLVSETVIETTKPATTTPAPIATQTPSEEPELDPGTVIWSVKTNGAIYSSPTVANGIIYYGSDDHFFRAGNVHTGETIWQIETGDRVRSRPAIANENIYFTSDDGYIYALDAQAGTEIWKTNIHNDATTRGEREFDYQQSSPAVADNVVYAGSSDGSLYAINAQAGNIIWEFKTDDMIRSSPTVSDGLVYVGSWDGNMYAIDNQTGEQIWQFSTGKPIQSSPVVEDGTIYFGSRAANLYALNAKSGEEHWRFSYGMSWVESSPTINDNVIYVGSSDAKRLYAIDQATGEQIWEFDTIWYAYSTPAIEDGVVYIGTMTYQYVKQGRLNAVDAQTGKELWHVLTDESLDFDFVGNKTIFDGVASSPVVVNGIIYFGSLDGNLYAVAHS